MKREIGKPENMQYLDTIILDGVIGMAPTNDETQESIGVLYQREIVTFDGKKLVETGGGFALTKEMEETIGWLDSYASVAFVISEQPIQADTVDEATIEILYGDVDHKYFINISSFTGYLWTDEEFVVGGHDLRAILKQNMGKYIHMEIELYREK